MTAPVSNRDKTCHCGHSGHDHDAGECWAELSVPGSGLQCACDWWEPIELVPALPVSPAADTEDGAR